MPSITKEETDALLNAVNDKYVLGENVYKFEEEFARYIGVRHAVSLNSGGSGLFLAQLAAGIKGEVVVPAMTFIATSNSVLHAGLKPIFCDISPVSYNIDSSKIQKNAKAIIPVHLYGNPVDMAELRDKFPDSFILEDACQAHGSTLGNKKIGSFGDAAVFSFYPSKNMTVMGDGGMVATNDEKLALTIAKLRDCGRKSRYIHDMVGYTMRLNSINAAVGRIQLRRLDSLNEKRRKIASLYSSKLAGIGDIILPSEARNVKAVYHLYVIKTKMRDALAKFLESKGIQTGIHYDPPLHLQPVYRDMFGNYEGKFPVAEGHAKTALSIPIFADMKEEDAKFVAQAITDFFDRGRL